VLSLVLALMLEGFHYQEFEDTLESKTAEDAMAIFTKRLEVSLDDLLHLYQSRLWDGRSVGGPNLAILTSKVRNLEAKTASDEAQADRLYQEALGLQHNTVTIPQKLSRLNSSNWSI
jgi:hypothetical protein